MGETRPETKAMGIKSLSVVNDSRFRTDLRGEKGFYSVPSENDLRIKELTLRLITGDRLVEDELITLNIPLAKRIAYKWSRNHWDKHDDLYCTAMMALVQGVRWAGEGRLKDEHLVKYLSITIQGKVRLFLEQDHVISMNRWSFRKKIKVYKIEEFFPMILSMNETADENLSGGNSSFETPRWEQAVFDDDVLIYEDLCTALSMTEFEHKVVDLRVQSYTLVEIGNQLGCTDEWIRTTLGKLAERWVRIFGQEPNVFNQKCKEITS